MASYLKLLLAAFCLINACSGEFIGVQDFQAESKNGGFSINDNHGYYILANAEFTYDAYLTSVEFFATGPSRIGLSFMGFGSCGRENEESCQEYMNQNMVGIEQYVPWSELAMIYIESSAAGYVKYDLPEKMVVPRGYTPYIIQVNGGLNFVPSQEPDLVWPTTTMNSNLVQLKTADGSPVKAFIRFTVEPAQLSSEPTSYGVQVPTEADDNTVLEPAQGHQFFLINAPITHDSYITDFNIFASAAGNVTLKTTTFYGCQIGESESCVDLLLKYQLLHSAYWAGMAPNGMAEQVELTLQEGFNSITLPRPLFAQRNSVLTLNPQQGQVALEKADVAVSDLSVMQDSNGQYTRVGSGQNEAFLVSATVNYFD